MVGRDLVHRAHALLPILGALPQTLPESAMYRLFMGPFLSSLQTALAMLMDSPGQHIQALIDEHAPGDDSKMYVPSRLSCKKQKTKDPHVQCCPCTM
jgi:hypothetical protein